MIKMVEEQDNLLSQQLHSMSDKIRREVRGARPKAVTLAVHYPVPRQYLTTLICTDVSVALIELVRTIDYSKHERSYDNLLV